MKYAFARVFVLGLALAALAAAPASATGSVNGSRPFGQHGASAGTFYGIPYDHAAYQRWGVPKDWLKPRKDFEPKKTKNVTKNKKVLINNDEIKLTITKKRVVKTVLKPAKNPYTGKPVKVKHDVDKNIVEKMLDDGSKVIKKTITKTKVVTKKVHGVVKKFITKNIFIVTLKIKNPSPA